jgi:hypothetical protein
MQQTWTFDCEACGGKDIKQPTEPVLKYIMDKRSGRGATCECCAKCAHEVQEYEKAERAAAAKERENVAKTKARAAARLAARGKAAPGDTTAAV